MYNYSSVFKIVFRFLKDITMLAKGLHRQKLIKFSFHIFFVKNYILFLTRNFKYNQRNPKAAPVNYLWIVRLKEISFLNRRLFQ